MEIYVRNKKVVLELDYENEAVCLENLVNSFGVAIFIATTDKERITLTNVLKQIGEEIRECE